jgi:cation diffusion facilitator CzcD-associated flavoprotein CzcO
LSTSSTNERSQQTPRETHYPVVIIGAGFAGLAMSHHLKSRGIDDFIILERASEVGGTWRDNTYPGCACDVASDLYSLSFSPNSGWTRTYGRQPEILSYLKGVAAELNLGEKIHFNCELLNAQWQDERQLWHITTSKGDYYARALITGTGPFGSPKIPELQGQSDFKGHSFHSLKWDHEYDFKGKRVAVIGTGATATQIVPELQKTASELYVFQRTPTWILPRFDSPTGSTKKKLYQRFPFVQKCVRNAWYCAYEGIIGLPQYVHPVFLKGFESVGRWHLRRSIKSPELREKLEPDFRFNCKRTLLSDTYYPTLEKRNVHLVTDRLETFLENGIRIEGGREVDVDVVVYATGFEVPNDQYKRFVGKNGKSLYSAYADEMSGSYLGTSSSGFPNLFTMLGSFSAAGNQSAIFMLETQADYIARVLETMAARDVVSIDVKASVQEGFVEKMHRLSQRVSWVDGGCTSYYQDQEGKNLGLWPNWSFKYRSALAKFYLKDFDCVYTKDISSPKNVAAEQQRIAV